MCFQMKILSYNCRGFVSPSKKSSLKHLVGSFDLNVVFIQETLGDFISITQSTEFLLIEWSFVAVDTRGHSVGMAMRWKIGACRFDNVWGFGLGIGVSIYYVELGKTLSLINVYGPYLDIILFWDRLLRCSFMD